MVDLIQKQQIDFPHMRIQLLNRLRLWIFDIRSSSLSLLIMLTHCVRNLLSTHASILNMRHCSKTLALQHARGLCRASASQDLEKESLLQLFVDRYYISPGQTNMQLFQRGRSCRYGPLGTELRRNVLDQWWHSVSRSGAQVFGISSVNCIQDGEQYGCGQLRITDSENFAQTLEQKDLSNEQLIQKMRMLLQRAPSVRTDFLQGTDAA